MTGEDAVLQGDGGRVTAAKMPAELERLRSALREIRRVAGDPRLDDEMALVEVIGRCEEALDV